MADLIPWSNLLPSYQSPGQMAQQNASIQQTQAQTGLLGAQTQGADIANQSAALTLGAYQNAINGGSAGSPGGAGAPGGQPPPGGTPSGIGQTGVDPNDVTDYAISKFAPIPTARPPSVTQQMYQWNLAGKPEVAASIGAQYDQQVAGANQQRQLGANAAYQTAEQVANAPAGAAFETLNRYDPQAAAAVKAKYPDDSADQLDADVRTYAQHIGIATHQYTGRDAEFQNGVLVDKKDGAPVLGSSQVLTGLDAKGKQAAFDSANDPVTVGDQLPQPRWKAAGYPSAEAFVIAADRAARSSAAAPAGSPAQNGPPPGQQPQQPAQAPQGNTAPAPKPSATPVTTTQTADPVLKQALSDTSYRYQRPAAPLNQSDLAANTEQAKANVTARQTLKTDSDDATKAAAQAQAYLQAAKSIVDSKGATLGAYGGLMAQASKYSPFTGDATNYQEVAKYLGNAALSNARGIYGNRMTQSEVGLQLNELSPSVHMTDDAIRNLINTNLKSAQYTIDSAKRVVPFLAAGNDPANFGKWNQQYWNQSNSVNGPPARPGQQTSGAAPAAAGAPQNGAEAVSKSGKPIVFQNGHWQYKQ
jgi:hypothetical protein